MLSSGMRPSRLDLGWLLVVLAIALAIRVWAPWSDVFGPARVNFLETDAWYHVRLVENQVRHFPHHVTRDPYASRDGQYVAVAPLFDTIVAAVVFVTRGPSAPTAYIERVAALAPPLMGIGAVIAVWALAMRAFDRRAGPIAALLAAILPGHFLDRTLVGFVDHHALEAWLAMATLASIVAALRSTPDSRLPTPVSRWGGIVPRRVARPLHARVGQCRVPRGDPRGVGGGPAIRGHGRPGRGRGPHRRAHCGHRAADGPGAAGSGPLSLRHAARRAARPLCRLGGCRGVDAAAACRR